MISRDFYAQIQVIQAEASDRKCWKKKINKIECK